MRGKLHTFLQWVRCIGTLGLMILMYIYIYMSEQGLELSEVQDHVIS